GLGLAVVGPASTPRTAAVVVPVGVGRVTGKRAGDSAAMVVGGLEGGDQARSACRIQPAFDLHLDITHGSVAGKILAGDLQGFGFELHRRSALDLDVGADGDVGAGDVGGALSFVVAGDD